MIEYWKKKSSDEYGILGELKKYRNDGLSWNPYYKENDIQYFSDIVSESSLKIVLVALFER